MKYFFLIWNIFFLIWNLKCFFLIWIRNENECDAISLIWIKERVIEWRNQAEKKRGCLLLSCRTASFIRSIRNRIQGTTKVMGHKSKSKSLHCALCTVLYYFAACSTINEKKRIKLNSRFKKFFHFIPSKKKSEKNKSFSDYF